MRRKLPWAGTAAPKFRLLPGRRTPASGAWAKGGTCTAPVQASRAMHTAVNTHAHAHTTGGLRLCAQRTAEPGERSLPNVPMPLLAASNVLPSLSRVLPAQRYQWLLPPPWGHYMQPPGFPLEHFFSRLHVMGERKTSTDTPRSSMDMHHVSQPQLLGVLPRVNRLQSSGASAQQAKVLVIANNYAARLGFLELMGVALTLRT